MQVSAGENVNTTAGNGVAITAAADYSLMAGNILEVADGDLVRTATNMEKTAGSVKLTSTEENVELHSSKDIDNRNRGKIKLF